MNKDNLPQQNTDYKLAVFLKWILYAIISIVITLQTNVIILFILSENTTCKIAIDYFDGLFIYIIFSIGLSLFDFVVGLLTFKIPHNRKLFKILSNEKLVRYFHITIYIVFFAGLIISALINGEKVYNNYHGYVQDTNQNLEEYGYKLDIDENSDLRIHGVENKPKDWLYDLEYKKEDNKESARVRIDFDYSSESLIVYKIRIEFDLTEGDNSAEVTEINSIAEKLHGNETPESLESKILEMIQQYKIEKKELYASYDDESFTQFYVNLKESENENCDYLLSVVINYFGRKK